jgi:hypothetical protein
MASSIPPLVSTLMLNVTCFNLDSEFAQMQFGQAAGIPSRSALVSRVMRQLPACMHCLKLRISDKERVGRGRLLCHEVYVNTFNEKRIRQKQCLYLLSGHFATVHGIVLTMRSQLPERYTRPNASERRY